MSYYTYICKVAKRKVEKNRPQIKWQVKADFSELLHLLYDFMYIISIAPI